MIVALFLGSICMLLILGKYIYTRHKLLSMKMPSSRSRSDTSAMSSSGRRKHESIYDRWLIIRFAIGFICLSIFQLVTILFQLGSMASNRADRLAEAPDLSGGRATMDFILFMPGVTASLLVFVVFGTTRPFRRTMYETLVPKRWQKEALVDSVLPTPYTSRVQHTPKEPDYWDRTDSTEAIAMNAMGRPGVS